MREPTRRMTAPWPFLWSVAANGVLVRNVQPKVKPLKLAELKPVPLSNQWRQGALL